MHCSDGSSSSSSSSNLERSEIVPLINLLPRSDATVLSSGVDLPLLTSLDGDDSSASGTSRHNFRKEIPVFGGQETKWTPEWLGMQGTLLEIGYIFSGRTVAVLTERRRRINNAKRFWYSLMSHYFVVINTECLSRWKMLSC